MFILLLSKCYLNPLQPTNPPSSSPSTLNSDAISLPYYFQSTFRVCMPTHLIEQRRLRRYQSAKKHFTDQEFKPDTWDMGYYAGATS
jgi:hypothetical protein